MEFSNGIARDGFYSLKEQEEEVFWRRAPASSAAWRPWDAVAKEHMFDKVVTPSDVGKLNRLVIPKQHAEKYFPLSAGAQRAGLLLSFEDREGGAWRFRYSYWSSSQSYVITKGWSRFVKEKRLDAGDTVSFARARGGDDGSNRLFIDWRRRPVLRIPLLGVPFVQVFEPCCGAHPHFFPPPPPPPPPPPMAMVYQHHSTGGQLLFFQTPENGHRPAELKPSTARGGPVDHCQSTAGKAVWLFGVNLVRPELNGEADAAGGSEGTSSSTAHPLLQLQHSSVESSSLASSSSTSKEQHSCLDLDL